MIEGRVLSATDGQPLKKASVFLEQTGGVHDRDYTTTTAAGGWFAMQDVEPGKYSLSVTKNGFARMQYGARRPGHPGTTLSLDPGQHVRDVILQLVPQAVITGRVTDEDGQPVPQVRIEVLRYRYERGKRRLDTSGVIATNDLGDYRAFGLSPGKYYLSATPQVEMDDMDAAITGQNYAPTFYPGTVDPSGATALDLPAGVHVRGADIPLVRSRTVRLRGRIVEAGKFSPENWNVMLARENFSGMASMSAHSVDNQGRFEFLGVIPGGYFLIAQASRDGKVYGAHQPIQVKEADIENITVELSAASELKGQMRVEGRPLPNLRDVQISLESDSPGYAGWPSATVRADGSFSLANIAPERYRFNVYGLSDDYYIQSARFGDQDILESGIEIAGGTSGLLEVVLSSNGGQVEGVVLDAGDQPASGATVALVPDAARRTQTRIYQEVTTDQYGRFIMKSIAPGGYKLFAWEDVESGEYQEPEFLKRFETLGHSVGIREGRRESAQLKLIPADGKKAPRAKW
jgi:protocatechuate 3,4-dioxygenase beta subunit